MPDVNDLLKSVKGNKAVEEAANKALDAAKEKVEEKVGRDNKAVDTAFDAIKKKVDDAI